MTQQLFGIDRPEGAVRVVIRPIVGRGNAIALFDGRIDETASEADILTAASRNAAFWDWVDAQVRGKRVEAPADGFWNWKLRIQWFNAEGVGATAVQTAEAHEFYRGTGKDGTAAAGEDVLGRIYVAGAQVLDKLIAAGASTLTEANKSVAEANKSIGEASKAVAEANKSVGAVGAACANALAEVSKQTQVLATTCEKLQDEATNLKALVFKLMKDGATGATTKPKTMVDEIKEVKEVVSTVKDLAGTFLGDDDTPAAPSGAAAGSGDAANK